MLAHCLIPCSNINSAFAVSHGLLFVTVGPLSTTLVQEYPPPLPQQTQDINPMSNQFWTTVCDADPTSIRHWIACLVFESRLSFCWSLTVGFTVFPLILSSLFLINDSDGKSSLRLQSKLAEGGGVCLKAVSQN